MEPKAISPLAYAKQQLGELDAVIKTVSTNQDVQIEWLCRPLHKPTDGQRANLLKIHLELGRLKLKRWHLVREIAAIPRRSRHYAKE